MKNFALIGVGGFIAPRHLKAISETGNNLMAALDPNDSVGIMDSYFPEADFFTEFERFDRHIDKLRRNGQKIDYVSICSPNYLHDAHIRFALRNGADAICEKPLVLNPWNVDALKEIEEQSENRIWTILQLRLHPSIIALKEKIQNGPKNKVYDVDLTYIASRGNWYHISWKGDISKSGGVATNIGVHFFDMISWIFGKPTKNVLNINKPDVMAGYAEMENARLRWFLSVNSNYLPENAKKSSKKTCRSITVDKEELEFSGGFDNLHTKSYEQILNGNGFPLSEAGNAIQIVYDIRHAEVIGLKGEYHENCSLVGS